MSQGDDKLDRGREFVRGKKQPDNGESVIDALERKHGPVSRILLRDDGSDSAPLIRVQGRPENELATADDRYLILGEIARGGVGIVFKSRETDLGRDVAVKVLRSEFTENSPVVERFIEEAQIGGQLQHPGIVPVYGLGIQADGRPWFAMKFVRGDTLSAILLERSSPSDEHRRFLVIFRQICETIAYAHARGVVHRDLKPSNVMIGAFGEVQVVDWGFAKVLGSEDTARDRPDHTPAEAPADAPAIATIRSVADGSQSIVGSVMGTPPYMPPEQALGKVEELTERSDVFSLGAILAEILTGKPPYVGEGHEALIKAARSQLDEAYERLAECSADEELVELTKACLSPDQNDRPKDAGELSERLVAYLAGMEERAKRDEIKAANARARAERERVRLAATKREALTAIRSRKRTMILAASFLLAIFGSGVAMLFVLESRRSLAAQANADVSAALNEATGFRGQEQWEKALAAVRHAAGLAGSRGADSEWRERIEDLREEVTEAKLAADRQAKSLARDATFAARIEAISLQNEHHVGFSRVDSEYAEAFRSYGADIATQRPIEAAEVLRNCTRLEDVVVGLASWAFLKRRMVQRGEDWPAQVLMLVEQDAKRRDMWRAVVNLDLRAMERFANAPEVFELPPVAQSILGNAMMQTPGGKERAARFLREAWARRPDDIRILAFLDTATDGSLHDTAAMVLRPGSAEVRYLRGAMYEADGREDEALKLWQESLRLDPDSSSFVVRRIARMLEKRGEIDEAIATYREGIEKARDSEETATHRYFLSLALAKRGDLVDALEQAEMAEAAGPPPSLAHSVQIAKAKALNSLGRHEEAETVLRLSLAKLGRQDRQSTELLASLRFKKGDVPGALRAIAKGIELDPDSESLWLLRVRYIMRQDPVAGRKALREMYRRFPVSEWTFGEIVRLLEKSESEYHELVEDDDDLEVMPCPSCGRRHRNAAYLSDAIAFCREHLRNYPLFPRAQMHLGVYLILQGLREEGEKELIEGLRLRRYDAYSHEWVSWLRQSQGRYDEAVDSARRAVALSPSRASAWVQLAASLYGKGDRHRAGEAYRKAWKLSRSTTNLDHLLGFLVKTGRGYERIALLNEARKFHPWDPGILVRLGNVVYQQQGPAQALPVFEEALRYAPKSPGIWALIGVVRLALSQARPAIEAFEQAIQIGQSLPGAEGIVLSTRWRLARLYQALGEADQALKVFDALHRTDPESFEIAAARADHLRRSKKLRAALAALEKDLAANPDDASLARQLGLLLIHGPGDFSAAEAVLREAVRREPENARGLFLLGTVLAEGKDLDKARSLLRRATENKFPESVFALHRLGYVLRLTAPLAEALDAHEKGLAARPTLVDSDHFLSLLSAARLDEAIALAQLALKPGSSGGPWVLPALANALRLKGQIRDAEDLEKKIRTLAPGAPGSLQSLGNEHLRAARFTEATTAFRKALEAAKAEPGGDPAAVESLTEDVRLSEAAAALDGRWKEISSPGFAPKDAGEAHLCFVVASRRDHPALATRFAEKAISLDPERGARAATFPDYLREAMRAAGFEGFDGLDTSDEQGARLRGVALAWFRALVEQTRSDIRTGRVRRHIALLQVAEWKMDDTFSGLRDDSALFRFSDEEGKAWTGFWKDVSAFHRELMEAK